MEVVEGTYEDAMELMARRWWHNKEELVAARQQGGEEAEPRIERECYMK